MKPILPSLFAALALCAACADAPPTGEAEPQADATLTAEGRDVAVAQCASCHALDGVDESPNPAAPPMAGLLARYDADMLSNDLIEGIRVGHDEMPTFDLSVRAADALVAYLKSIRQ